jgi:hypothetical protein
LAVTAPERKARWRCGCRYRGLDRPTSLEIINNTAYVVTLGGEIWTIDNIAGPPFGRAASGNPTAKGNR